MKLTICHLYPDILNLYGDRGNVICLTRRMEARGIETELLELPMGERADFTSIDLFFVGGGQDFEQGVLLADLNSGKADEIKSAIEDGKVFLAICGGYQMLGQYYKTWDGTQQDFIGALDIYTVGKPDRMTGDYMYETEFGTVVGFENHSGRTFLGAGVEPLGRVLTGYGNNGEDGTEGARYKNTFCSYAHGPLLPKNPVFADLLLETALKRRYPEADLSVLDDTLEMQAHEYMRRRLSERKQQH